jgi:hypothetical protein
MATERSRSKKAFDLVELARDPRFIPGIYNYCDRWCERCPFTARCLVYIQEQQHWGDTARDVTNAEFWNKLGETFQQTIELVRELAAEQGIDVDKLVAAEPVVEAPQKRGFQGHRRSSGRDLTRENHQHGRRSGESPMSMDKGGTMAKAQGDTSVIDVSILPEFQDTKQTRDR